MPQGSEVQGIGITEQEKPVAFAEIFEQLDAFRRKVEEQGIPTVDNCLIGNVETCQLSDRIDELPVGDTANLIVFKKGRGETMAEVLTNVGEKKILPTKADGKSIELRLMLNNEPFQPNSGASH